MFLKRKIDIPATGAAAGNNRAVVPNETYAMIVDVLAGKIMTELSASRPGAARETAVELFALFEQGVSARSINPQYLVIQIMDIYLSDDAIMGDLARSYFMQIAKHGLDLSKVDPAFVRDAVAQVAEHCTHSDTIEGAQNFARLLLASSSAVA